MLKVLLSHLFVTAFQLFLYLCTPLLQEISLPAFLRFGSNWTLCSLFFPGIETMAAADPPNKLRILRPARQSGLFWNHGMIRMSQPIYSPCLFIWLNRQINNHSIVLYYCIIVLYCISNLKPRWHSFNINEWLKWIIHLTYFVLSRRCQESQTAVNVLKLGYHGFVLKPRADQ